MSSVKTPTPAGTAPNTMLMRAAPLSVRNLQDIEGAPDLHAPHQRRQPVECGHETEPDRHGHCPGREVIAQVGRDRRPEPEPRAVCGKEHVAGAGAAGQREEEEEEDQG